MVRLADADGAMRMSDLADRIVTAKSAVTYQVNKLSEMGLVERHKCDRDNRGVWVKLTGAGSERLEQAAPCILSLVREMFLDAINCDQAAELDKLLGTWSDNLDEHDRNPIGHGERASGRRLDAFGAALRCTACGPSVPV